MKVLLTATVQSHICQFHIPLIKKLKELGAEVHVGARDNLNVKPGLKLDDADMVFNIPFARNPLKPTNFKAYFKLKKIIKENNYDVIHCNTPVGAFLTRLASIGARRRGTKVIYTAHGFHFFKGAPMKNWLMYFPLEWILAPLTDVLITINTEDFEFAEKHLAVKSVKYLNGVGFDASRWSRTHEKAEAREILGIPKDAKVMLSIGELNKRKNHQVILKALDRLKDDNIYWFIAGNGPLEGFLKNMANELGLASRVVFLGYTRELATYLEASDLFVFPSLQEGLPFALMEVMSFGLPIVASDIRGTRDLIKNNENGYLVDKFDDVGFAKTLKNTLDNIDGLKEMVEKNKEFIKDFEVGKVIDMIIKEYGL